MMQVSQDVCITFDFWLAQIWHLTRWTMLREFWISQIDFPVLRAMSWCTPSAGLETSQLWPLPVWYRKWELLKSGSRHMPQQALRRRGWFHPKFKNESGGKPQFASNMETFQTTHMNFWWAGARANFLRFQGLLSMESWTIGGTPLVYQPIQEHLPSPTVWRLVIWAWTLMDQSQKVLPVTKGT